ncbi:ATP-binding cassette domain-containing protein [Pyxidicoccus sp. 3LFB2]
MSTQCPSGSPGRTRFNAHDFILNLPQGYDALVGKRSTRLSIGKRQRVSIARSLLKNPPILILDEPTSTLDAELKSRVQDALNNPVKGRTAFVIAHQVSSVVDSDRILVLKGGRIVEDGAHEPLMAQQGYHASLVRRQTRGLLPDSPFIAKPRPRKVSGVALAGRGNADWLRAPAHLHSWDG